MYAGTGGVITQRQMGEAKGSLNGYVGLNGQRKQLTQRQAVLQVVIEEKAKYNLDEIQQKQADNLGKLAESLQKSGQRKIEEAAKKTAELEKGIAANNASIAASRQRQQERYRLILINTLGTMIATTVESGAAAKEVAKTSLLKYEGQENLIEPINTKSCMRMTSALAQVILDIFKSCSCKEPNLSQFKDEFDLEALRVVLTNENVSKVIFDKSAKGSEAEKVAQKIAESRKLEIVIPA